VIHHSVAEDLEMSAGIATEFKTRFGQVDALLAMGRTVGQVAVLPVVQKDGIVRYVFYIITKKRSRGTRPNLADFSTAVHSLADACDLLGVKQLALPRIGTMKDRLLWTEVWQIIAEAFGGRKTEVFVFRPEKQRSTPTPPKPSGFIGPQLPTTPISSRLYSEAIQQRPPSPPPATPQGSSAPENWSCPLPDGGTSSAAEPGPCAANVVSEKKEDAVRGSSQ
jgi:hypothetical protein